MIDAADLRMVTMRKGAALMGSEVVMLHKDDVDTFIAAQERLHFNPCRNPHSGLDCAPLAYLRVDKLDPNRDAQFWWSTPSLNPDGNGAKVLGWAVVTEKHYPPIDEPIPLIVAK
jgi:hypothetical protein